MKQEKIVISLNDEDENIILDPEEEHYTPSQLDEIATEILRAHSKSIDPKTGKPHGLKGILFEEHLYSRKRREIYNMNGTPDPNIASGNYWRSHPQGRKVNTPEQRKRNGASYYR
jgi:hypothetical protein